MGRGYKAVRKVSIYNKIELAALLCFILLALFYGVRVFVCVLCLDGTMY